MEILIKLGNGIALLAISFLSAIVVITFHEFAHAYTSFRMGDKLPKFNRRLTLNPASHIDFIGLLFMVQTGLGWGNPVETSARNYKDKKKGNVLVGLSGLMASLMLGMVACAVLSVVLELGSKGMLSMPKYATVYTTAFLKSVFIMSFNYAFISLLPLKIYDGFMIWGGVIPPASQFKMFQYQGIIISIFILIILISPDIFLIFIEPLRALVGASIDSLVKLAI